MTTRKGRKDGKGQAHRRQCYRRCRQEHSFHFTAVSACNGEIAPESARASASVRVPPFLSASLHCLSLQRNNRPFATPPYLISIYPSPLSSPLLSSPLRINPFYRQCTPRRPRPAAFACVRGGQSVRSWRPELANDQDRNQRGWAYCLFLQSKISISAPCLGLIFSGHPACSRCAAD